MMVKFKDMKFGKKMMLIIGCILILLSIISIWSISGLTSVVGDGIEVADGNRLRGELLQREVDHLNWAKKVSAFLTDDNVTELAVQLDHTKCGFGKWYYGEGRKGAEGLLPSLKGELDLIGEPHRKLHESAIKIKGVFLQADAELPAFLTQKELDHVAWTSKVQDAIIAKEKKVGVQLDHTKCSFGKFLYGDAGRKMSESDEVLARLLGDVEQPHKELHQHGRAIDTKLGRSDFNGATHIYQSEVLPVLKNVRGYLAKMQEKANQNLQGKREAEAVYASETQTNLSNVQEHLRTMTEMAKENILSEDQMVSNALATRLAVILISVLAVLIGAALSVYFTRSITGPLSKAVKMIGELEKGHVDQRLNLDRGDEIGQMAKTMDEFADSLQHEVVASLEKLAAGDITFEAKPRDDQDVIRGALKKTAEDLNSIMAQIHLPANRWPRPRARYRMPASRFPRARPSRPVPLKRSPAP